MKFLYLLILSLYLVSTSIFAKTLMVKVVVNGQQHKVVNAWLVEQDFPATTSPLATRKVVNYQVLNKQAEPLALGKVQLPRTVSGSYLLATEQERAKLKSQPVVATDASYYIRIANYDEQMHELRLFTPNSLSAKAKFEKGHRFLLADWLNENE